MRRKAKLALLNFRYRLVLEVLDEAKVKLHNARKGEKSKALMRKLMISGILAVSKTFCIETKPLLLLQLCLMKIQFFQKYSSVRLVIFMAPDGWNFTTTSNPSNTVSSIMLIL